MPGGGRGAVATWGDQSSFASVPGAVGGSSTLSPSGRWGHGEEASGTEEGGPGRAAWPEGGRGPGGPPHPELLLGRTLGAPEGAACWPVSQKRESPPLHLDFLPRVGGRPWGTGRSQKAPPESGCAAGGASDGRGPPSGELRLPGWMKESGLRAGRSQALRLCASCPQRRASGACQAARRAKTLERGALERGALDRAGRPRLGGPSAQRGAGGISTRPLPSP